MCGISGKYAFRSMAPIDEGLIQAMAGTMTHRGPDDEGFYSNGSVGMGHNRLAIIDLNTGKQPLCNEDGTVWIVFNGEIYNFRELRKELIKTGHRFHTESDTEVIVHLYEEYGDKCLNFLRGMFAFAIWDEKNRDLFLARDRVGIKPLYYSFTEDGLVFASEIKALLEDPLVDREIDPQMVDRFLTYYYLPGEGTLFKKVRKLLPGHYMTISDRKVHICQYWDLEFREDYRGSLRDAEGELSEIIRDSVACHLISDVPVGFLLSGGVDSTALLSFASENTDKEVSSFTIGFEGQDFADERPYARLAAETFGTKHYETTITAQQFQDFLPEYVRHMEEPVCEPPAVALYFITRLAKQHVKVLISGEGGDEAFAGYPNYRKFLWVERLKRVVLPFIPGEQFVTIAGRIISSKKLSALAPYMDQPFEEYYLSRTSSPSNYFNAHFRNIYTDDFQNRVSKDFSCSIARDLLMRNSSRNLLADMLYVDTKTWLPDDLLLKADKMTMANSVELRVPLLDHKFLEFAACLPGNYKTTGFTLKRVLKRAFRGRVPAEILKRKKTGFPVPYETWLRNEMQEYVWDTMTSSAFKSKNYFKQDSIVNLLNFNSRTGIFSKEIFSILVLELWHRCFVDSVK